jgi:hypothetical protein
VVREDLTRWYLTLGERPEWCCTEWWFESGSKNVQSFNWTFEDYKTMSTDQLTLQEAYLSMFEFIVELYNRTKSDELGALLGDLSLLDDGSTADPAAWEDWLRCVEKARQNKIDANLKINPPIR